MSNNQNTGFTMMPNILFSLAPSMSCKVLRVVMVVARETIGWHRSNCNISIDQFVEESGLEADEVVKAIEDSINQGIIERRYINDQPHYELSITCNASNKNKKKAAGASVSLSEHIAILMYHEKFQLIPTDKQRESIISTVQSFDTWRMVLEFWEVNNYRPQSVGRMLEKYLEVANEVGKQDDARNYTGESSSQRRIRLLKERDYDHLLESRAS
jgi:hypothetical protein